MNEKVDGKQKKRKKIPNQCLDKSSNDNDDDDDDENILIKNLFPHKQSTTCDICLFIFFVISHCIWNVCEFHNSRIFRIFQNCPIFSVFHPTKTILMIYRFHL